MCIICCNLWKVIDNSFTASLCFRLFQPMLTVVIMMKKWDNVINHRYWEGKIYTDWCIICHYQWRMICVFSIFSDDYFIWNWHWLFDDMLYCFALYFDIKWEWQLRWLLASISNLVLIVTDISPMINCKLS